MYCDKLMKCLTLAQQKATTQMYCQPPPILMMIDEKTIKTLLIYVAFLPMMSSSAPHLVVMLIFNLYTVVYRNQSTTNPHLKMFIVQFRY